jgi:hypothetical protein
MESNTDKLIALFERKIDLLLEKNEGYARFKGMNPLKVIREVLSKETSKADIVDLGFLLHLYALELRLTMYKNLTPFSILNFKKDLQEIINVLHAYSRHRNPQTKLSLELPEAQESKALIPPLIDISRSKRFSSDNTELYNVILDMFEQDVCGVEVEIPEDIIKEMQYIDLKKIYDEIPKFIERKKQCTVRELASDFPVFENERLSLVAVFNEILFLANEGKVCLRQMEGDVGVSVLM